MPRSILPMGAGAEAAVRAALAANAAAAVRATPGVSEAAAASVTTGGGGGGALVPNTGAARGPLTAAERYAAENLARGISAAGGNNTIGAGISGYHLGNSTGHSGSRGGVSTGGMSMMPGSTATSANPLNTANAIAAAAQPFASFQSAPYQHQQSLPFPWPLPAFNPNTTIGGTTTGAQQQQQQHLSATSSFTHPQSAVATAVGTAAGALFPDSFRPLQPPVNPFARAADMEVIEIDDDDDDDDNNNTAGSGSGNNTNAPLPSTYGNSGSQSGSSSAGVSNGGSSNNNFDARWAAASKVVNNMIVDFYKTYKREATQLECDLLMNAARQYLGLPSLPIENASSSSSSTMSTEDDEQRLTPYLFRVALTQAHQEGLAVNFSIILGKSIPPPIPLRPPPPQQQQQQSQQQRVEHNGLGTMADEVNVKVKKGAAALALITAAGSQLATLSAVSGNNADTGSNNGNSSSSSYDASSASKVATCDESAVRSVVQALLNQV